MGTRYFTDREFGQRPAVSERIEGRVWDALQESIKMLLDNGAFGYRFTAQCADGDGPCGCDRRAFARFVKAEVPSVDWPLDRDHLPETPVILDLLEFCAAAVGEPILGSYHSFQHHHHMRWDRGAGLSAFVDEVNTLFQRNGIAFKLDADGHAQRILPQPVAQTLGWTMFRTGAASWIVSSNTPGRISSRRSSMIAGTPRRSSGTRSSA